MTTETHHKPATVNLLDAAGVSPNALLSPCTKKASGAKVPKSTKAGKTTAKAAEKPERKVRRKTPMKAAKKPVDLDDAGREGELRGTAAEEFSELVQAIQPANLAPTAVKEASERPSIELVDGLVWITIPREAEVSNHFHRFEWQVPVDGKRSIKVLLNAERQLPLGGAVGAQVRVVTEKHKGKPRMRLAVGWDFTPTPIIRRDCRMMRPFSPSERTASLENAIEEGLASEFPIPGTEGYSLIVGPVGCGI